MDLISLWIIGHISIFVISLSLLIFIQPLSKKFGNKIRELDYGGIDTSPFGILKFLVLALITMILTLIFFPTSFLFWMAIAGIEEFKEGKCY